MTYSLGWPVVAQTVVRRERWPGGYRVKASPLVSPGQEVVPDQPVMRLEREPTALTGQAVERKRVALGDPRLALPSVDVGISQEDQNGSRQVETIPAGLHGRVVQITGRGGVVIESQVAVIQGVIGIGNQVAGVLTIWQASSPTEGPQAIPAGAILVVPGPLNFTLLRQAVASGVSGIVASSISLRDLEGFLRSDLLRLIMRDDIERGQEYLPPMTLLLTEGIGSAVMPARVLNLLSQYEGAVVLLAGNTSLPRGIVPELLIPLPVEEIQQRWQPIQPDTTLAQGAQVRMCTGEREGVIGIIDYLFVYEQVFSSGVRTRALRLRLEDGSMLVVPLTAVERIG